MRKPREEWLKGYQCESLGKSGLKAFALVGFRPDNTQTIKYYISFDQQKAKGFRAG